MSKEVISLEDYINFYKSDETIKSEYDVKTEEDVKQHNKCLIYHEKGTRGKNKPVETTWTDIGL